MRKILFIAVMAVMLGPLSSFAVGLVNDDGAANGDVKSEEDSSIAVIAWFDKSDTLTYWISEGQWKVQDNDTVQTMGVWTKVMLTVTDSTKKGYDMEYRFLEFDSDTLPDSEIGTFMNTIVAKLRQKVMGTSIRFHTDEFGHIEKYYNLREIKKQAKALYGNVWNELMRLPMMDSLRSSGIDIGKHIKKVDTDELMQGYVEELELMFNYHGMELKTGERNTHKDATDEKYASDTYIIVDRDTATMEYRIAVDVDSYVPTEDVAELLATVVESVSGKKLPEDLDRELAEHAKEPFVLNSYYEVNYLPSGWPRKVLSQESKVFGNRGKLKQTRIVLSSCNF